MKQIRFVMLIALFSSTFSFSADSATSQVGSKEAAQNRQAEINREMFCSEKAVREKAAKRDLATLVTSCMDVIERSEQAVRAGQRGIRAAQLD